MNDRGARASVIDPPDSVGNGIIVDHLVIYQYLAALFNVLKRDDSGVLIRMR